MRKSLLIYSFKASGKRKTTVAGFARIQNVLNSGESSYESRLAEAEIPRLLADRLLQLA